MTTETTHDSDGNAFRAPKTPSWQETNFDDFNPVNILDLKGADVIDFLWEGYLSPGHTTLLSGIWKGGKTTMLAHLLRLFGTGGELGMGVHMAKVLVVSEESESKWKERRDAIGIGGHVDLYCRPFRRRPKFPEWFGFIDKITSLVRTVGYGVVIFDPLTTSWPVQKENDAGQVIEALMPLHGITDSGAAVLLIHHPRKGDGTEGQAARGSGALAGWVDVIIELRRYDPQRAGDRRRTLTSYSRFDETPSEMVIELTDDGYRVCGTRADASQADRMAVIANLLKDAGTGVTAEQVWNNWPEDDPIPRPGKRTVYRDLKYGAKEERWNQSGEGKKKDPYLYSRSDSFRATPLSIGHETQKSVPKPGEMWDGPKPGEPAHELKD